MFGTRTVKALLAASAQEVKLRRTYVLKQDLISFFQIENKNFLHPAEGETLCQVLESARNNLSRCGPCVWISVNSVSLSLM